MRSNLSSVHPQALVDAIDRQSEARVSKVRAFMAIQQPEVDVLFVVDSQSIPSPEYAYLGFQSSAETPHIVCITADSLEEATDFSTFFSAHDELVRLVQSGRVAVESTIEGALYDTLIDACKVCNREITVERLSIIAEVRREKTNEEIDLMDAGQSELLHFMKVEIPSYMYEGMTEYELAQKVEHVITHAKQWEVSFPAIVAFGEHGAVPHHRSGERRLKNGEPVLIDCGNIYMNRVCTDMTRNYWFGDTQGVLRAAYVADYERLQSAQELMTPLYAIGNKTADADRAIREYVGDMPHGLGHGIAGRSVHALPYISKTSPHVFQNGDVVTNEPGIYREGTYGMRIEDMIAITPDGPRVFGDGSESRKLIDVPHRVYEGARDACERTRPKVMTVVEQKKNILRIQTLLRTNSARAYICIKTEESVSSALEVLIGFQGTHGYLVVTADNAFFITDGRYEGAVQDWKDTVGITPLITRRARVLDGVEFSEMTTASYLETILRNLTNNDTTSSVIHIESGASLCAEAPLKTVLKEVGYGWVRSTYL